MKFRVRFFKFQVTSPLASSVTVPVAAAAPARDLPAGLSHLVLTHHDDTGRGLAKLLVLSWALQDHRDLYCPGHGVARTVTLP